MRLLALALLALLLLSFVPAAEAGASVTLGSPSRLTLDLAQNGGVNTETPIRGSLADSTGLAVAGAQITVKIDGVAQRTVFTGTDGRFSTSFRFPQIKTYNVTAEFAGKSGLRASAQSRSINVVSVAIELPLSIEAKRGETIPVTGGVIVNSAPYRGATVRLRVDATNYGPYTTDDRGNFTATITLPANAAPGTHAANYTTTVFLGAGATRTEFQLDFYQTIEVRMNGTLSTRVDAPFPAEWRIDAPFSREVQLADERGRAITGVKVRGLLDGPGGRFEASVATNAQGLATFRVDLPQANRLPGVYNMSFSPLSGHVRATNLTTSFALDFLRASWADGNPTVLRQTTNASRLLVDFGANRTANWTVEVVDREQNVVLPSRRVPGGFEVDLAAEVGAELGTRDLLVRVPEVGYEQALEYEVKSRPKLTLLESETKIVAGREGRVVFSVVDELGKPLSNVPVEAELTAASGWEINGTGITDANGRWAWNFAAADAPAEPLSLNATSSQLGFYGSAETQSSGLVPVAAPAAFQYLPYLLGGVLLVGAGGGAAWVLRKRAAAGPAAAAPAVAAAVLKAKGKRPSLALELLDAEGLPPVWGMGDPFRVAVRAKGLVGEAEQPLAGRKVKIETPLGAGEIVLDAGGEGGADGLVGPEGEFVVKVSTEPDENFDGAEVALALRLVDYRREVSREFEGFVERATLLEPKLRKSSTPREVQWRLAEKMGSAAEPALEDFAGVIELANYTERPISREHYVKLVRAARALGEKLPAGGAAGGG